MDATPIPQFRVARPSRDLDAAERFYTGSLGLTVLARFEDHDGFDGVVLGRSAWPYHLELTRRRHAPVSPSSTEEDLLVFYLPDVATWNATVARLRAADAREVPAANPYWRVHGVTFMDPDGYRIVLQNGIWP